MKIFHAGAALCDWGGIERHITYLAGGLEARGNQVFVGCAPRSPLFERLPVNRVPVHVSGRLSPASVGSYLKAMRETKPDVVHVHFSPDFMPAGVAARLAKVELRIMTRHLAIGWQGLKLKRNLALWEHFIPVSDAVKKVLIATGVPELRMTVAKAGVPAVIPTRPPEAVREELGIAPDELAVGSFGRLVKEKGIDVMIQAAPSLHGVTFHIFGDGPERPVLERMVAAKGLGQWFKFYGYYEDPTNAMAAMNAVAIPSVWPEAFPSAALEAMSAGVPVVASKIGGMPEVIRDGVNGLLFKPSDPNAFAQSVLILKADKSLGPGLGETGKEIHRSRYTVEAMCERIEGVYKKELQYKGWTSF